MFAYNPGTQDRSGEIMAAGQMAAAQTQAQMMSNLGDDIGGAIASLANSYATSKAADAEVKGYDEVFKMFAPQLGVKGDDIERFLKMGTRERRAGYEGFFSNMGPYSNAMMSAGRFAQQGANRAAAAAAPAIRQQATAKAAAASGQRSVGFDMLGANPSLKFE
jgi:hypothetical protein